MSDRDIQSCAYQRYEAPKLQGPPTRAIEIVYRIIHTYVKTYKLAFPQSGRIKGPQYIFIQGPSEANYAPDCYEYLIDKWSKNRHNYKQLLNTISYKIKLAQPKYTKYLFFNQCSMDVLELKLLVLMSRSTISRLYENISETFERVEETKHSPN